MEIAVLGHRQPRPLLILSAAVFAVLSLVAPANAAGSSGKPTAKSIQERGVRATTPSSSPSLRLEEPGEDEDEAGVIAARAEFHQSITAAPAEVAPAAGLAAATTAASHLATSGGRWREVTDKPFLNDPVERGANFGVGWGFVTGRMTALTSAGRYVYAGAASGGVWRSSDSGAHWRPVNTGLPRLAVGALATDPRDGSVWVGTGEANNASENQYGVGIYRLARGSSTWQRVGGTELFGAGVHRIAWIRGYVYAATSHGLYRRAATARRSSPWQPVLQPAGPADYPPSSEVTDVIALPGTSGRSILAVVGWAGYSDPPGTEHNGFYVGSGSSGSFTRITPTGDINPATIGRTTLSTSGGWLYAVLTDTSTGDLRGQGAFVSRTGRAQGPWTRIADVDKLYNSDSALGPSTSDYYPGVQADYNQYILADPRDRRHVYLQLEEVFESTDGGDTWKAVGPYWNFDISCEEAAGDPYDCPMTTHPDQHAGLLVNGEFWAGNDGGLWRRPAAWHQRGQWTNLNPTLYTLQNYSVAVGPVGKSLAYWGGLQDNGESYTRTDMSRIEQAFTGDGGDTIVDPQDGNKAVEEYVYLDMYLTTDGATNTLREISPSCLTATDPPAQCDPSPRFIAPIEQDVTNPEHWVAGGRYVWDDTKAWDTVCTSAACDWKQVYDTGVGHSITALAANGAVTYAGWCGPCNPGAEAPFRRGLATNYGGSWHELSMSQLPNRYITSVAIDPANGAHAYVSFGSYSRRWIPDAGVGHVFETTNGGATWTDVSGNLPDAPVYKIVLHGSNLIVGTEVGTFIAARSSSRPSSWRNLGTGLPRVTVWDLTVAPDGRVVAGTHGRGTWEIGLRR
jgi:hypothetical protein